MKEKTCVNGYLTGIVAIHQILLSNSASCPKSIKVSDNGQNAGYAQKDRHRVHELLL